MNNENETLRFPSNLDRTQIVERLIQVRTAAVAAGLTDIAGRFENVENLGPAEIGANVIGALTSIQEKPEYAAITTQLGIVAMNLKNLK